MMGWVGAVGWAGWTVTAVCVLAFWAVAVYLMTTMFRTDRGSARPDDPDAQRLLEARFARGEIDADEFVARRQVLAQTTNSSTDPGGTDRPPAPPVL